MAKTFAGARLRRLREDRGISQVDLSRQLGISASYLNQIEHDARPLTVPVLIRITELFGVDTTFFAPHDIPRLVHDLREALPPRVTVSDLTEVATKLPEVAEAVIELFRRYRQAGDQLAEIVGDRELVAGRSPHDQVSDFFYRRQNYVPDLDEAAEALAERIGVRRGETRAALAERLADRHGIRITRDDAAGSVPDGSVDLVVCNPPFHLGLGVHAGAAERLFAAAARVLRPGGELWCVYNSHLPHRESLRSLVGPTRQVSRDPVFTVAAATRR